MLKYYVAHFALKGTVNGIGILFISIQLKIYSVSANKSLGFFFIKLHIKNN